MTKFNEQFRSWATRRTESLLAPVIELLPDHFYLAGGCFGKVVRDLDLYPMTEEFVITPVQDLKRLSSTKNASTWSYHGRVIQMCNYKHNSLSELVESFDFAHIQVGVEVRRQASYIHIKDVYVSEAFILARMTNDSWYTGSKYPLSSLVRLLKYHKREEVSQGRSVASIIGIISDVVNRGFADYEDFKDQLDAVDLGLVPEDMDDISMASLKSLFDSLCKEKV